MDSKYKSIRCRHHQRRKPIVVVVVVVVVVVIVVVVVVVIVKAYAMRDRSHATHPNVRLPGDGPESRMQRRTQDASDVDAEKKEPEKKKSRERFELMLENEFGTWISRMSTLPKRN